VSSVFPLVGGAAFIPRTSVRGLRRDLVNMRTPALDAGASQYRLGGAQFIAPKRRQVKKKGRGKRGGMGLSRRGGSDAYTGRYLMMSPRRRLRTRRGGGRVGRGGDACVAHGGRDQVTGPRDEGDTSVPTPHNPTPAPYGKSVLLSSSLELIGRNSLRPYIGHVDALCSRWYSGITSLTRTKL
jgi:hypothetical protein